MYNIWVGGDNIIGRYSHRHYVKLKKKIEIIYLTTAIVERVIIIPNIEMILRKGITKRTDLKKAR